MKHSTVIGFLTSVPHGGPGDTTGYFFETSPGKYLSLKFAGGYVDSHDLPMNTKIALCMSNAEIDGFRVVCTHKPYYTELRS